MYICTKLDFADMFYYFHGLKFYDFYENLMNFFTKLLVQHKLLYWPNFVSLVIIDYYSLLIFPILCISLYYIYISVFCSGTLTQFGLEALWLNETMYVNCHILTTNLLLTMHINCIELLQLLFIFHTVTLKVNISAAYNMYSGIPIPLRSLILA